IRLKAAKGVRQTQTEALVQLGRDGSVNLLAVLGRRGVLVKIAQIPAAGDDVGALVQSFQQDANAVRLMLAVAVHGDQYVDGMSERVTKSGNQGRSVAAVGRVRENTQGRGSELRHRLPLHVPVQYLPRLIRGPVIHDQDSGAIAAALAAHAIRMWLFVVDRNRGEA